MCVFFGETFPNKSLLPKHRFLSKNSLQLDRVLKKPPPALAARPDVAFKPRACGTPSDAQIAAAFARLPPECYFVLPAVTDKADDTYSKLTSEIYRAAEQALAALRLDLAAAEESSRRYFGLRAGLPAQGLPALRRCLAPVLLGRSASTGCAAAD